MTVELRGILHDLSNALTGIMGWADEAGRSGVTDAERSHALSVIVREAKKAHALARHALGQPAHESATDALEVANGVVESLSAEARKKGVQLLVDADFGGAKVDHSLEFHHVLMNLVLNGIQHTREQSAIHVRGSSNADALIVDIQDEGPGIPQDREEDLFSGVSTRPGGAGIGLAHARLVTMAQGGNIQFVRADGGAIFRLEWPIHRQKKASLAGQKILLLEDDAGVRDFLVLGFERLGAFVHTAQSFDSLRSDLGPFDVAVLDYSPLAGRDVEAQAALGQIVPSGRLVLTTGDTGALAKWRTRARCVQKPFELADVVAAVVETATKSNA